LPARDHRDLQRPRYRAPSRLEASRRRERRSHSRQLVFGRHVRGAARTARPPDRVGKPSLERFPADGPKRYFDLRSILRRKEEIAVNFPGRWIINGDSDEVRTSPWPGVGLREGLRRVDEARYTAVDFVLLAFRLIDDSYRAAVDPETHFRYFNWGPPGFLHIKAWKQPRKRVDLASTGGHEVRFRRRTVFPEKFHLKHYPLRHPDQARRKIFVERLGRLSPKEVAAGWHVHYARQAADNRFLWDPATLVDYQTLTKPAEP
jgi:hypothetical protein